MANGKKSAASRRSAEKAPRSSEPKPGPRQPKSVRRQTYAYPESDLALRPEIGTQPQFRKKKPPQRYRYDSSLSPAMEWDGQNPTREQGEWLIAMIEEAAALPAPHRFDSPREFRSADGRVVATVHGLRDAVDQLKRLSQPFLNWAGKSERLSFNVPTLPLFVHERLSTKAIVETLKSHRRQEKQPPMFELFADPRRPIADQVLKAYKHRDQWVNRMILGDNLAVMNSLLHYEGLGGQVQMIYVDPPYGVKFGSNFQPFVRKRDVTHNDDADFTREPEMVKAYRDTWELGLHSYLTYLRDRLLLARELLHPSGSIFVQISDENVHHVRKLMDEVFKHENFVSIVTFSKTTGSATYLSSVSDYLLWYAKDVVRLKYRQLFRQKQAGDEGATAYKPVSELPVHDRDRFDPNRLATSADLTSQGESKNISQEFEFLGQRFVPPRGLHWKARDAPSCSSWPNFPGWQYTSIPEISR